MAGSGEEAGDDGDGRLAWLALGDGLAGLAAPAAAGRLALGSAGFPAERSQSGKRPATALEASAMTSAIAMTAPTARTQNCDLLMPLREPAAEAGPDRHWLAIASLYDD
jgi:hypothetical protein